jgi:hypothetical protein
LYCWGISISADNANNASFCCGGKFLSIILEKFTNYNHKSDNKSVFERWHATSPLLVVKYSQLLRYSKAYWQLGLWITWKLSKLRAGILSSNCCIMSQGPSPTPTRTIDRG